MKKTGKKINPKSDPAVKAIWDADRGEVYVQTNGSKIVYYPDGNSMTYPARDK